MKKILFTFYCFLLFTDFSSAATNYVWISSPVPASPYTSWATASHSIQDAVSAAAVGNVVLVTNGVYTGNGYSDDRIGECVVANRKNIILKSVNGWDGTVIDGQNTRRCIFSTNGVIVGFTLRNGLGGTPAWYYFSYRRFSFGGGALVKETCVMSNCFVFNCSGYNYGGGICVNGGGFVFDCVVSNCSAWAGGGICIYDSGIVTNSVVVNCEARDGDRFIDSDEAPRGGGISLEQGGLVEDCFVANNLAKEEGGGIAILETGKVERCVITGNYSSNIAGGVYFINGVDALIQNCIITNNEALWTGGGARFYNAGVLRNCLVADNYCNSEGGGVFTRMQNAAYSGGNVESCTIVSNSVNVGQVGGGIYINGRGIITNSIIYYNFPENIYNSSQGQFGYCCATPLVSGAGNISDAPGFTNGYKLAIGSSCINAGLDEGWMTGAKDLAGNSRIIGGQVDMGCYETVPEPCVFGAVISYLLLVIGIWQKK